MLNDVRCTITIRFKIDSTSYHFISYSYSILVNPLCKRQDVVGFQVPMEYVLGVHVLDSGENLLEDASKEAKPYYQGKSS